VAEQEQEKTEQATPKRKEDAREKGQVAKSREVSSAAILISALIYFWLGDVAHGSLHGPHETLPHEHRHYYR